MKKFYETPEIAVNLFACGADIMNLSTDDPDWDNDLIGHDPFDW